MLAHSLHPTTAYASLNAGFDRQWRAPQGTTGERSVRVRELGRFIRDQRASARLSLRKLSKLAGVSNPYLSQVERGLRHPSAEILQGIAKALRVSSQTLYVKAGMLEESPHPDVHTAVMGDPTLTEQQKQVLLQVYDSFREET